MQSHIIRAPLSRIMGLVPLMSMLKNCPDQDGAELKKMLEYLEISAKELDEVIKDIIELNNSRIIF